MKSDAELVGLVLGGEREVFAMLVERYERPVRAIALRVVGDREGADDAAQEAFVRAYEHLDGLRKPAAFGCWLMRIARRCAVDFERQRPREMHLDAAAACSAASGNGQLDERKQVLLAAVMRLPRAERQVVMLRYFSGHKVREVAEIAGRSVGTVTKQLSRAHRRLRTMLKEQQQ